jgi:hypothetical protein
MFHSDAFTDMTEIQYKAAVGAGFGLDTLTTAATNGRLFCCDYNMLAPKQYSGGWKFFRGRETAHLQMYVACLFYLHIDFVIFDP